jgi:hypothetical protein
MIAASAATSTSTVSMNLDLWVRPQETIEQSRLHSYALRSFWGFLTEHVTEALILGSHPYEGAYEPVLTQKSTEVTAQIEEVLNWLAQKQVMIPQPAEVRDYLLRHSHMIVLLPAISERVLERCGRQAQLSLEVYRDPEIDDEYLALYIRQERYDKSILNVIDSICAEFETELASSLGWLLVTTDLRPLR